MKMIIDCLSPRMNVGTIFVLLGIKNPKSSDHRQTRPVKQRGGNN